MLVVLTKAGKTPVPEKKSQTKTADCSVKAVTRYLQQQQQL